MASSRPIPTSPIRSRHRKRSRSANETLERRVAERTAELTRVNEALRQQGRRQSRQDAVPRGREPRLLQPLNAARLYASSLIERALPTEAQRLASNVDSSLEAVEEILGALLDISRLDAGQLEPEITGRLRWAS